MPAFNFKMSSAFIHFSVIFVGAKLHETLSLVHFFHIQSFACLFDCLIAILIAI